MMKQYGKILFLGLLLCVFIAAPVFSQNSLEDLRNIMDAFSENMAKSLPFNASMGLNWSDAYIGKFFPALPPHFGAGVSLGYTTLDAGSFNGLLKQFGIDLPINLSGYPLPGWALEGRLGGFFLPFDIGVKFGWLPIDISSSDLKLDYLLTGFDLRYALLEGKGLLPRLSVGAGFNYLKGGLTKSIGEERKFDYTDLSNTRQTLTLEAPKVGISWETATLDFKAQISKTLLIVTPYLGVGASVGWSKAGYKVETKITDTGNNIGTNMANQIFGQLGIDNIDANGFFSIKDFNGWSFRAFGGVGLSLAILKIDLTGLFNFIDQNYGISLGARIQL